MVVVGVGGSGGAGLGCDGKSAGGTGERQELMHYCNFCTLQYQLPVRFRWTEGIVGVLRLPCSGCALELKHLGMRLGCLQVGWSLSNNHAPSSRSPALRLRPLRPQPRRVKVDNSASSLKCADRLLVKRMAKGKSKTILCKLVSAAQTGFFYVTSKNPRRLPEKLVLRK